jgi:Ca2+-transporting ATPase
MAAVKKMLTMAVQSSQINPLTEPHTADAVSVAEALLVEPSRGLIESEAKVRRARFGANELPSIRPRSAWHILVDQFLSLIVALLAFAAIIAWATGDRIEAVAILVVLALNALLGFAIEWQANRALDALRKQARVVARVRRDRREMAILRQSRRL